MQRACQQGKPFVVAFVDMRVPGWDGIESSRPEALGLTLESRRGWLWRARLSV